MHTTPRLANRLATTLAIGTAIAASLLPLPVNAVNPAPCPAVPAAADAPAVAYQPGTSALLGMARETLGTWTAIPDRPPVTSPPSVASPNAPTNRQPASASTRPVTAPLTLAELDARVSRYRRLPSSSAQPLAATPVDGWAPTLAQRPLDNVTDNHACQP